MLEAGIHPKAVSEILGHAIVAFTLDGALREAKRQRLIGYNPADDAGLPAAVREVIGADRVWTVGQLNAYLKGGVCRGSSGARGRTRTCDLRFRRPTL